MSAEKRARELLAAEYRKGDLGAFADLLDKEHQLALKADEAAISAIIAALTPQWQDISTAPRDGTMHLRGLWVQQHTRDGVATNWEVYHGFENQDGDFVDAQHGEDHGWPANEYHAWLPLPAPPECSSCDGSGSIWGTDRGSCHSAE